MNYNINLKIKRTNYGKNTLVRWSRNINKCRDKTIDIILISIIISMMSIFSLIKQGIVMEKVLKTLLNIVLYTILTVFLGLSSLAFLLGLAEGDLSHGLFYYLQ